MIEKIHAETNSVGFQRKPITTKFASVVSQCPEWAHGVISARQAVRHDLEPPNTDVSISIDPKTNFTVLKSVGLSVVVVDKTDGKPLTERLNEAIDLAFSLRSDVLALAAISVDSGVHLRRTFEAQLGRYGILVVDSAGSSAQERATKFVSDFQVRRLQGLRELNIN